MQSDLSVENGLFRLKPKSGFLTQSKKGFFDSTFFDGEFRLADPVEKLDFFDWIPCQSKNSVRKHDFLIPPHPTGTTAHHSTAAMPAWLLSLLLLLTASQRGAFLSPPASGKHHTLAAARGIDDLLPTAALAVAVAALEEVQRLDDLDGNTPRVKRTRRLRRKREIGTCAWAQLLEDRDLLVPASITAKQFRTDIRKKKTLSLLLGACEGGRTQGVVPDSQAGRMWPAIPSRGAQGEHGRKTLP